MASDITLPHAIDITEQESAAPPGLLRRLPTSGVAMTGLGIIVFWVILAIIVPLLPLPSPTAQDYLAMGAPGPSWKHLLGVDSLGRDTLSRLLWGARIVLMLAPSSVLAAYTVGACMGLLAGYYGGWVDALISRVSDVILSFPVVVLYVVLIAAVGASALNIVVAVILASAPGISRIVRSLAIQIVRQDYIAAARLRRETAFFIMAIEMLPNCRGPSSPISASASATPPSSSAHWASSASASRRQPPIGAAWCSRPRRCSPSFPPWRCSRSSHWSHSCSASTFSRTG